MNKVAIITVKQLFSSPNILKYYKILGQNIDIIYPNKMSLEEDYQQLDIIQPNYLNFFFSKYRLIKLIHFRHFVKKNLKSRKYHSLVIFPSQTALLLFGILRKYKKRYIYEIHDYSYENNILFKYIQKRLIKNSRYTLITSRKFKTFLPQSSYEIIHNVNFSDNRNIPSKKISNTKIIKIAFIGVLKFDKSFIEFIDDFANCSNFIISFIGQGSERLKLYCNKHNISNTRFIGRFDPKDTHKYYLNNDLILNTYGSNSNKTRYALSNKLYYSTVFHRPIIVSYDTYMAELVNEFNIGYIYNPNNLDNPGKLIDYYKNLDYNDYILKANFFIERVKLEQKKTITKLKGFYAE